jgi:hypothetical protein
MNGPGSSSARSSLTDLTEWLEAVDLKGATQVTAEKRPEKLELIFSKGGRLTATLLWEKAPRTCAAIVGALPVTSDLLHARNTGAHLYFEYFPIDEQIPFENTTCRSDENHVLTNKHPGGVLTYYPNPEIRCFGIPYGEIIPHGRAIDVVVEFNVYAEIDNKEDAKEIGEKCWREGPGSVTVRVLD